MTGVTWETKPDGKPGWQSFSLGQGHDVYVCGAVERGRVSWSRFPEVYTSEPFFRPKHEAWTLFRVGATDDTDPARRAAYPGTQFPIQAFDQFAKQFVPRWSTNDPATQAAYDAPVQRVGPCVIMVHSQGSTFALRAALNASDTVKGIIAIQPGGAPDLSDVDLVRVQKIPQLVIWGDYVERSELWTAPRASTARYCRALAENGGKVEVVDLPNDGVHGNSHMLMMDRNSDQIAGIIQSWMKRHELT